MKSATEWVNQFNEESDGITCEGPSDDFVMDFIKRVQADAFHYGELKGLQDAREIVNNLFGERKYQDPK